MWRYNEGWKMVGYWMMIWRSVHCVDSYRSRSLVTTPLGCKKHFTSHNITGSEAFEALWALWQAGDGVTKSLVTIGYFGPWLLPTYYLSFFIARSFNVSRIILEAK
jgi:hypothetical protein